MFVVDVGIFLRMERRLFRTSTPNNEELPRFTAQRGLFKTHLVRAALSFTVTSSSANVGVQCHSSIKVSLGHPQAQHTGPPLNTVWGIRTRQLSSQNTLTGWSPQSVWPVCALHHLAATVAEIGQLWQGNIRSGHRKTARIFNHKSPAVVL